MPCHRSMCVYSQKVPGLTLIAMAIALLGACEDSPAPTATSMQQRSSSKSSDGRHSIASTSRMATPRPVEGMNLTATTDSSTALSDPLASTCLQFPCDGGDGGSGTGGGGDGTSDALDPDGDGDIYTYDESHQVTDGEIWSSLEADNRLDSLLSIAKQAHDRAEALGVVSEVKQAYQDGDTEQIRNLMNYSESEFQNIEQTAQDLYEQVYSDYEPLQDEIDNSDLSALRGACSAEPPSVLASEQVEPVKLASAGMIPAGALKATTSCNLIILAVEIFFCATGTGPFFPLCAWVAICHECPGAVPGLCP